MVSRFSATGEATKAEELLARALRIRRMEQNCRLFLRNGASAAVVYYVEKSEITEEVEIWSLRSTLPSSNLTYLTK